MVDEKTISTWIDSYYLCMKTHPYTYDRIKHSFSYSQLQSKKWLGEELNKFGVQFTNAAIIGGWWCHYLAHTLSPYVKHMCNYEVDPACIVISKRFNRHRDNYTAIERDVFTDGLWTKHLNKGEVDLVINTSCEHMAPMRMMKHHFKNPLYVLQSTDEEKYRDHTNTVKSPEELAEQAEIEKPIYSGSIKLDNGMNRFMVIGR